MKKTVQNDLCKIDKEIKSYMELLKVTDNQNIKDIAISTEDIQKLKDKRATCKFNNTQ